MVMRFVDGYTYAEIAEQLELSESAIKMRVSRGSKQLRELYEQRLQDSDAILPDQRSKNG